MINEYLETPMEVGTVLKYTSDSLFPNEIDYYIVGKYFIYCNDYNFPEIRPHKFVFDEHISIASEDEKKKFIEDLKKNHLIWNEKNGKLEREYEEITLSVKVRTKQGMSIKDVIHILNNLNKFNDRDEIKKVTFEDF